MENNFKPYKSIDDQVKILKSRGMIFTNEDTAKQILFRGNYYNVINGYKNLFLDKEADIEKFIDNTNFDELVSLFLMDKELKNLFLKYTLLFESEFKSIYAYEFTKKYPEIDSYLMLSNYNNNRKIDAIKCISLFYKTICDRKDKYESIVHHYKKYNHVPLWVLVNVLTFGNISKIYDVLNPSEQDAIAKVYTQSFTQNNHYLNNGVKFRISPVHVITALKVLTLIRNICAHDEILFNIKFNNVKNKDIMSLFNIYTPNLYPTQYKLIAGIIYLRLFLQKEHYTEFHSSLINIFNRYRNKFHTIPFETILDCMGINEEDLHKLKPIN